MGKFHVSSGNVRTCWIMMIVALPIVVDVRLMVILL